jgi:hypothetical protein
VDIRLTGVNIAGVVKNKCVSLGLQLPLCVGQGMDGAANMSSAIKGAAAELRKSAPLALYFHCMLHCFNLCASQSINVKMVRNCMDVVAEMANFFSNSAKRQHALEVVLDGSMAPESEKSQNTEKPTHKRLQKLCDTRFVERHTSIVIALQLLPYVHDTLQLLSNSDCRETRQPSITLLHALTNFQFIVTLVTLSEISALLMGVSRTLQSKNRDIIQALSDIRELVEVLSEKRSDVDTSFSAIYIRVEQLAKLMGVKAGKPRTVKRSVYRANTAVEPDANEDQEQSSDVVKEYYKLNMYIPLLDGLLSHLRDRFGPTQEKALSLGYIVPAYLGKDFKDIEPALELYGHFITSHEEVRAEFTIWRHRWRDQIAAKEVDTAAAALEKCPAMTMPNLHALLYVLTTLPVTTAEPERVFSKVENTASCIRNMGEERLESLILLQAHRDKTPSTSAVLDCFAMKGARRLDLIL